ncbi:MAG: nucleotidyltransferase domain-containing protein [Candidatus Cloacimonetes bacterium]|nr:nucleotidyltransferase domain-containing protein [Candidatus Cloacimonadota bacterium]
MEKKDILKKIKASILKTEPSAKIILYGSHARGDSRKNSDWDLLILLNKNKITNEMEKAIKYPLYEIEWDIGEIISPLIFSRMEWEKKHHVTPFYKNVTAEGIEL